MPSWTPVSGFLPRGPVGLQTNCGNHGQNSLHPGGVASSRPQGPAPPSSSRPCPGPHGAPSSGPSTCWPPPAALLSSVPTPPPSHARCLQRTPGTDSGTPLSPAGRQLTPARPDAVKGKQRRSLGSRSRPGGRKTSTLVSLGKRIHCDAMAPEMNGPKTVEGRSLFGITSRDKRSWS